MDIKIKQYWNKSSPSFFSTVPGLLIAGVIFFFALVRSEFSIMLLATGVILVSFSAKLWARLASAAIRFAMKPDKERLFPGETLTLELELENNKFLPVWINLELSAPQHLENQEAEGEKSIKSGLRLLSWEKSRRDWRLVAKQRGVSSLGPALISAGDLLGLDSRTKAYPFPREIIVFPRKLRMLPLSLPFQEYFGMNAARGPVEDPAWYAGTRDYTGMNPAKNIHWKASARLGTLQEKLYEPTFHHKVLFVFDAESYVVEKDELSPDFLFRREKADRDFERMLETLGTLASALAEAGAAFGLVSGAFLVGSQEAHSAAVLPAGHGPEHLGSFLEMLARVKSPSYPDYEIAQRPLRLSSALAKPLQGYTSLVYCGASTAKVAKSAIQEAGRRKKILFIFSNNTEPFFMKQPACMANQICFPEEEEK